MCGSRASLVDAVVPLAEVVRDLREALVARQPTGLAGTAERTGEHERERAARQIAPEGLGLAPARRGERHVGAPRVLPAQRPLGLAVPDQPDLGRSVMRPEISCQTAIDKHGPLAPVPARSSVEGPRRYWVQPAGGRRRRASSASLEDGVLESRNAIPQEVRGA